MNEVKWLALFHYAMSKVLSAGPLACTEALPTQSPTFGCNAHAFFQRLIGVSHKEA